MKALLWKDYRINRSLLITGAALLVAPYVLGVSLHYFDGSAAGMSRGQWADSISAMLIASMALSLVTISLLAANAFTFERADRSVEFLITLPPSRFSILASKFTIGIVPSIVLWVANLLVIWVVILPMGGSQLPWREPLTALMPTSALLFGAGWAASTWMTSLVGAWGIATLAPMIVGGALVACAHFFGVPTQSEFGTWYATASVAAAIASFTASSLLYLRRVGA